MTELENGMIKCTNLCKSYATRHGAVKALDGVCCDIRRGEVFGLVGESGCGKTTLGKVILGLVTADSGKVDVSASKMQVVFQDPFNSLDPKLRIADIIGEGLDARLSSIVVRRSIKENEDNIKKILDLVKLPEAALAKYPHQFSGGERQRIAIARALVTEPDFIVCDEPVSSLDVTIQLQILRLLKEIHGRLGITYLFISHDLRVIRFMCDRVAVMKAGKIIEEGTVSKIYSTPSHTYTKTLVSSIPAVNI
jgi:ABC-type oligopeptide transport system ATPase subunit